MPTITIYLTNELYDKVKNAPSKTVRTALEHYFKEEGKEAAEAFEQPQPSAGEPGKSKDPATSE
jgi:hypothetical protein